MKKLLYSLIVLLSATRAFSSSHTVSNAAWLPAQFATVQEAINAASAGDTILISATGLDYVNSICDKQLYFFSAGGMLGEMPKVYITLANSNASGSWFEGLGGSLTTAVGNVNTDINNVTVRRCRYHALWIETTTAADDGRNDAYNWVIEGCVFTSDFLNIASPFGYSKFHGWTVRNCIFNGQVYDLTYSLIENCVFLGNDPEETALVDVDYSNIQNVIFHGQRCSPMNSIIQHCISTSSEMNCGTGTGNTCQSNFPGQSATFVNSADNFYSDLSDYHLQPNSLGVGDGMNGVDIGVFNSESVFRPDFEPAIPVVRSVTIPGGNTVPAEGSFQITIHTVSHQ